MEYFDGDYSEEIVKNVYIQFKLEILLKILIIKFKQIQKPDVYLIPRGNLDIEPEIELTEEEQRAKEKRMIEIKKMIALQSLQQLGLDDQMQNTNMNINYSNYNNMNSSTELNYEKEKKAREHVCLYPS